MKRLAAMKTADEPIQEEIEGLCVLAGISGAVIGVPLFGSPLLGAVLGTQLGPLAAFTSGPNGERLREAGWQSHKSWRAALKRAESAWAAVRAWSARIGLTNLLQQLGGRVRSSDASRKATALATALAKSTWRHLCFSAQRVRIWSGESGLTARLQSLWRKTGLPKWIEEQRGRMVLRARMQDLSEREQRGSGGGFRA